jgi:2-phospho-L-lactate transferase/gluconeogenesis factor (CofD/UPF0052 family)
MGLPTSGLHVVLFSGGRGSGALADLLGSDPRVSLTVAINGYDDGASTGEVRRFLGDALGPSDFRKNASRFARLRSTCPAALVDLLDRRLPDRATLADLQQLADELQDARPEGRPGALDGHSRRMPAVRLVRFIDEYRRAGRPLDFRDGSVGNFVFAGGYLAAGRDFNAAVDDYCGMLGLPAGLVENVTDGTNAFLVALDDDGELLASEEEIVDARRRNRVREIFLIDPPPNERDRAALGALDLDARRRALDERTVRPALNSRLSARLADAHLIIYAPGTQHSSLLPSYLTPGLAEAIAGNLNAIKLLITNIQTDAEITGRSAVDLIDRAVFYLREKGRLTTPAPCLITHYLVNDPSGLDADRPYVPLGRLESLEDPRLLRVGNYEEGHTGRHDATKVLAPYIAGFLAREGTVRRVAVVLADTRSPTKLTQSMLEMMRGGIRDVRVAIEVFHACETEIETAFIARLPFVVHRLGGADDEARDRELRLAIAHGRFEYVVLFDSCGMYNGEDVAGLGSYLTSGRLDAVWGSRRLSIRDIEESYRVRYRNRALLGAISGLGSHVLSLQFLLLHGRYIADTLSGVRALRVADALAAPCPLTHRLVNQYLLSGLLRRRADILEIPVQFFAISPDRVRRTTVLDGLQSVGIAVRERFRRPRRAAGRLAWAPQSQPKPAREQRLR